MTNNLKRSSTHKLFEPSLSLLRITGLLPSRRSRFNCFTVLQICFWACSAGYSLMLITNFAEHSVVVLSLSFLRLTNDSPFRTIIFNVQDVVDYCRGFIVCMLIRYNSQHVRDLVCWAQNTAASKNVYRSVHCVAFFAMFFISMLLAGMTMWVWSITLVTSAGTVVFAPFYELKTYQHFGLQFIFLMVPGIIARAALLVIIGSHAVMAQHLQSFKKTVLSNVWSGMNFTQRTRDLRYHYLGLFEVNRRQNYHLGPVLLMSLLGDVLPVCTRLVRAFEISPHLTLRESTMQMIYNISSAAMIYLAWIVLTYLPSINVSRQAS